MHSNTLLLKRLFTALDNHDHSTMASCYHSAAIFRDIAFDLRGRQQIHDMWRMICHGDIRATFEVVQADDQDGQVKLVDEYTFGTRGSAGRKVRNVINSRFRFQDGLIIEHTDHCDARLWASMALGGVSGFLAGRVRFLRSWKARKKLEEFVRVRPQLP